MRRISVQLLKRLWHGLQTCEQTGSARRRLSPSDLLPMICVELWAHADSLLKASKPRVAGSDTEADLLSNLLI